jgi:uncharacterized membrane protein YphA (DoxX/SURF4 family)
MRQRIYQFRISCSLCAAFYFNLFVGPGRISIDADEGINYFVTGCGIS